MKNTYQLPKWICLLFSFVIIAGLYSCVDEETKLKADLYFREAEKAYDDRNYDSSLEYIGKAEELLGDTEANFLALKIKAYYRLEYYIEAKKYMDIYTDGYRKSAAKETNDSVLDLFVKIEEEAEKAQMKLDKYKSEADKFFSDDNFVTVKGGSFMMGSEEGNDDEKPVHKVTVDGFKIAKTEVTVGQYLAFCAETGHKEPKAPRWGLKNDHPVVNVSWKDAMAFCKWASNKMGKTVTLPTEAQWEYAARGGRKSNNYKYSGSNILEDVAWYGENYSDGSTHPVAKRKANELGLYDMSGNVWEWCLDWYDEDYYERRIVENPKGAESGDYRVLRGGSWHFSASLCRSAFRNRNLPSLRRYYDGFRVVLP